MLILSCGLETVEINKMKERNVLFKINFSFTMNDYKFWYPSDSQQITLLSEASLYFLDQFFCLSPFNAFRITDSNYTLLSRVSWSATWVLWYELPACHYLSLFYHIIHRQAQFFGYFYACVQGGIGNYLGRTVHLATGPVVDTGGGTRLAKDNAAHLVTSNLYSCPTYPRYNEQFY